MRVSRHKSACNTVISGLKPSPFRQARLGLLAIMMSLLLPIELLGQSSLSDVVGIPPDAAIYPIPGLGFVNLKSGNLHVELPLRVVKDRNGTPLTTNISYDSSVWEIVQEGGPNGSPIDLWAALPAGDNHDFISSLQVTTSPNYTTQVLVQPLLVACGLSQVQQWTNFRFIDGHNTVHLFPTGLLTENGGTTGCPDIPAAQAPATDGSGYYLSVTNYSNAVVYDPHGNAVSILGTDTNGNKNTVTGGFLDRLGRSTALPSDFTTTLQSIHVWTNFNIKGVGELGPLLSSQVLSSIILPDGRGYSFEYDDAGDPAQQGHYGGMTGITLPTGGHITISYEVVPHAGTTLNPSLAVHQITTPDGTWTFDYDSTGTVTATAPADPTTGVSAQTTFAGGPTTQTVSIYQGSATGTPLRKVTTQFGSPGQVTDVATTLANGQASHIAYTYTDICNPRVRTKKEYDFSGSLLRETDITYFTSASDNTNLCKWLQGPTTWNSTFLQNGHHITDVPQSITVYGSSGSTGSPVAQTNFTYDSTALSDKSGSLNNSVLGLALHDDTHFGTSMTVRGNPTVISRMTGLGSTITTQTNYYNILGELIKSTDGNNNATNYDYSDNWKDSSCFSVPVFAYPTTITDALGHTSVNKYYSCDGSTASTQDQNDININNPGTVYTYDGLQRLINTSFQDGGNTSVDYGGSSVPEVITTTIESSPDPDQVSTSTLDSLGRTSQTIAGDGAIVKTTYDPLGRVRTVSNPYKSVTESTYGITTYSYDALGRTIIQNQPDNSSLQWCYDGVASHTQDVCLSNNSSITASSWVDLMDETGRRRKYVSDGIGRVKAVLEPDGTTTVSANPSIETDYQYDPLNNLTKVTQSGGALARTFTYDALSRLICAANPEIHAATCPVAPTSTYTPGTITYSYDNNSNLHTKVEPAPNAIATSTATMTMTFSYDALNRLTAKTYSDGITPTAHFNYDETSVTVGNNFWSGPHGVTGGIGRMTSWYVGSAAPGLAMKTFTYDKVGRPTQSWQCWGPDECNSTFGTRQNSRTYDLAGNITSLDNSLDASFQYTYDSVGRVTSMIYSYVYPTPGKRTIISQKSYTPFGQPAAMNNGANVWTYDKRLRPTNFSNSHIGTINYSYNLIYQPNGNVQSATESSVGNSWTWNYTYDNLNRLSTAVTDQLALGCQESYDRFGNRTSQQPYGGSQYACGSSTFTFTGNGTSNNNRIDGYCYDAAGNLLDDGPCPVSGVHKFTYDAENRMATANYGAAAYVYGADGVRTTSQIFGQSVNFVYDYDGSLLAQYGGSLTGEQEIWDQGRHIGYMKPAPAGNPSSPFLTYVSTDWLGTERVHTDQEGNQIVTFCNLPFGDHMSTCIVSPSHTGPSDPTFFTGTERDTESGLDYFGARYYASTLGRFLTPDYDESGDSPNPVPYADVTNPQSLNLYAYVNNNPISLTDPDGHGCFDSNATTSMDLDGNGNVIIQVNGNCNWSDFLPTLTQQASNFFNQVSNAVQQTGQQIVNYLAAPRDLGCLSRSTSVGAGALTLGGASLGLAGGPFDPITVPGGAIGGFGVGGISGFAMGMNACMTGNGGGGGGGKVPKKWQITNPSDKKVIGGRTYLKDPNTGYWWSKDTAGHGGSAWKVFKEAPGGLQWIADADEQGDYIVGKWKSTDGMFVSF